MPAGISKTSTPGLGEHCGDLSEQLNTMTNHTQELLYLKRIATGGKSRLFPDKPRHPILPGDGVNLKVFRRKHALPPLWERLYC